MWLQYVSAELTYEEGKYPAVLGAQEKGGSVGEGGEGHHRDRDASLVVHRLHKAV